MAMTHAASYNKPQASPPREQLPGLPNKGMTPEQQLEALQRVQNQAEQRVRLGLQLFKAAEAHTMGQKEIIDELKAEREKFRDELSEDVTRSLRAFDQWIGQLDETFTEAVLALEERMNSIETKMQADQSRLESMLQQSEKMLTQAQQLLQGQANIAPSVHVAAVTPPAAVKVASVQKASPCRTEAESIPPSVLSSVAPVEDATHAAETSDIPRPAAVSYADILSRITHAQDAANNPLKRGA